VNLPAVGETARAEQRHAGDGGQRPLRSRFPPRLTATVRRLIAGTAEKEDRMSLAMTRQEREAFLADVHVGIISIPDEGRGPLTVPIWYAYNAGGELRVVTARASRKGRLLARAGRFSLCAQTETPPYQYVSVEGPIISTEAADLERDVRPLAHRYLGAEMGDRYIEQTRNASAQAENVLIRMRPERWLTVDYAKAYGTL
jgi:nitroimidazol reductase NimA-like FMN-containing flavoprotein (pyridoxamine 5'-phosphate oxidase superfamily)